jgi:hypothetical protein
MLRPSDPRAFLFDPRVQIPSRKKQRKSHRGLDNIGFIGAWGRPACRKSMLGLIGATIDIFDPRIPAGQANYLSAFLGLNVVLPNIIGKEEQQRPF